MPSDSSRRTFLRGSALAMLSATAGCSFGTSPPSESGSGSGPGSETGTRSGSGTGSGSGSGTVDEPPGSDGGRTFSVAVTNELTNDQLLKIGVEKNTPAVVDVAVGRSVRGEEDPVLFEDTVEARPGESTTVGDAFDTETGESYQVTGHLHQFRDWEETPSWLTRRFQWEEGGFGAPEETVIDVTVTDTNDENFVLPGLAIE